MQINKDVKMMKKIVAVIGIVIAVTAMVLLGLQRINPLTFWVVIGLAAIIAFYIMPRIKEK
jgi:hypothetical protein